MTTTTTIGMAMDNLQNAAITLREGGWVVDIAMKQSTSPVVRAASARVAGPAPEATPVVAPEATPATVQEEVILNSKQARIRGLEGMQIFLTRSSRCSGGYKISTDANTSDREANIGHPENDDADGWINVYGSSLGTDVHSTKEQAAQYATAATVVAQLPIHLS